VEPSAKTPAIAAATAAFKSRKKSASAHPLELALLVLVGAHLSFLPWALGTMHVWSQLVSVTLSLAGFILALIPRTHTEDYSPDGRAYRYLPARRLTAFPGFWLGLIVLLYVLIQALNPAWQYIREGDMWWMQRVKPVALSARWLLGVAVDLLDVDRAHAPRLVADASRHVDPQRWTPGGDRHPPAHRGQRENPLADHPEHALPRRYVSLQKPRRRFF
jgi:hypothetical protein